uniref:Uncharacterized protein n=1 Tax=Haematobia irritans TaxID=7368 RepID=A0A1L8E7P6_HAEIR
MTARTCTLWNTTISSMLCASLPTVTGCALLMVLPSRSGIWLARKLLKNSAPISFPMDPRPINLNACPWPGPLMAKPCSLATPTTPFAYGKSLFLLTKQIKQFYSILLLQLLSTYFFIVCILVIITTIDATMLSKESVVDKTIFYV